MEKIIEKRFVIRFEEDEIEHISGVLRAMSKVGDKYVKEAMGIKSDEGIQAFREYNTEILKRLDE